MGRSQGGATLKSTAFCSSPLSRHFAMRDVELVDDREDYGEIRWISLGRVDLGIFRVVFTWSGESRPHYQRAEGEQI